MITRKGQHLIEINPEVRIPRTFKRFSGLMAQLLTKGKIQAPQGGATLMRITDAPIQAYIPNKAKAIQISPKGLLTENLNDCLSTPVKEHNQVVAVFQTSQALD
jgi:rRNA small subunit pseudouridine methyltransferase Nep1